MRRVGRSRRPHARTACRRRPAALRLVAAWLRVGARCCSCWNASRENGPSLPIRPWPVDALTMSSTPTPAPPQGPCGGGRDVSCAMVTRCNTAGRSRNWTKGQCRPSAAAAGAARCSARRKPAGRWTRCSKPARPRICTSGKSTCPDTPPRIGSERQLLFARRGRVRWPS